MFDLGGSNLRLHEKVVGILMAGLLLGFPHAQKENTQ